MRKNAAESTWISPYRTGHVFLVLSLPSDRGTLLPSHAQLILSGPGHVFLPHLARLSIYRRTLQDLFHQSPGHSWQNGICLAAATDAQLWRLPRVNGKESHLWGVLEGLSPVEIVPCFHSLLFLDLSRLLMPTSSPSSHSDILVPCQLNQPFPRSHFNLPPLNANLPFHLRHAYELFSQILRTTFFTNDIAVSTLNEHDSSGFSTEIHINT